MTADDLLLPSDVAALAHVSPRAVVQWERDGKLPAQKTPGGVRLFKRSDVESFLAKRASKEE